jgi:hypothetical protein
VLVNLKIAQSAIMCGRCDQSITLTLRVLKVTLKTQHPTHQTPNPDSLADIRLFEESLILLKSPRLFSLNPSLNPKICTWRRGRGRGKGRRG